MLLYILRGVPGSGKTTLAIALVGEQFARAADDFPGLYVLGEYQQSLRSQAHEWCFQEIAKLMQQQRSPIAVHNTFISLNSMENYLALAKHFNYDVQILQCERSYQSNGQAYQSVHNVPRTAVQKMYESFQRLPI